MTISDLKDIEWRWIKASPGQWRKYKPQWRSRPYIVVVDYPTEGKEESLFVRPKDIQGWIAQITDNSEQSKNNLDFILHAKEDIGVLLQEIYRLRHLLQEKEGVSDSNAQDSLPVQDDLPFSETPAEAE